MFLYKFQTTDDTFTYRLLADLLTSLEKDGFAMGTDAHLQVQQLLAALPENTPPEDLKTIICPLLAGSPEEQERFYALFDQSWRRAEAAQRALEEAFTGPPPPFVGNLVWRKHLPRVMGWLGLALIALGWWVATHQKEPEIEKLPDAAPPARVIAEMGGPERDFCLPDSILPAPIVGMDNVCPKEYGNKVLVRFDERRSNCLRFTPIEVGEDTICLELTFRDTNQRPDTLKIIFQVNEKQAKAAVFVEKPLPYLRNPELLKMPETPVWQQWLVRYQWWVKTLAILLLAWGMTALLRWRERQRQKLVAEYEPKTKAPYVWNIATGGEQDVALNEEFYTALNRLRQRTGGDAWRLNVPKTVKETIEKGGKMAFRYEQQTRPPEYLLLIDRQSGRNHRAQLFDFMFKKFKANEVLVERYFYDGDPRLCWNEQHPEGVFIKDLSHKYYDARLLMLGNGYRLLSPVSGRLAGWANVLTGWRERAILTPEPPAGWGRREASLEQLFRLAPSSVLAMIQTLEYFETGEAKTDNAWLAAREAAARRPLSLEGNLMERLYFYFAEKDEVGRVTDDSLLQWIAACAVYPELHWDLTLHLGRVLASKDSDTPQDTNLLTLDNLAQLARLPWFVDGEIPAEARAALLDWFEKQHPETLDVVRRSLHGLLQKNPPPGSSAAYDNYRMNLCLNEWLFTKDKKSKRELEDEIAGRQAQGHEADFTVVKVLERQQTALDFVLPDRWKKFLRPKDRAFSQWTDLLWAIPVWLFLSLGAMTAPMELPKCEGKVVKIEEGEWCIDSPEKELWAKEYHAFQFIRKQKFQSLDSLLKTIHPLVDANQLDTVPLYRNLTTGIYNQAVRLTQYQTLLDTLMADMTNQTGPQLEMNLQEFISFMNEMTGNKKQAITGNETLESISGLMGDWLVKFRDGQLSSADSSRIFKLYETKGPAAFGFMKRLAKDSSCVFFQRAARMESSLPEKSWDADILAAPNLACPPTQAPKPPPTENVPAQEDKPTVVASPISGRIVDAKSGKSIAAAFVLNKANNEQLYSDYKGYFKSTFPDPAGKSLELVVSKKGFENKTYTLAKENASKTMLIKLTMKDRDGDGISDAEDKCPDEQGEPKLGGCPPEYYLDRDGDGVPDREDRCPDQAGEPKLGGCPPEQNTAQQSIQAALDSDGDGVLGADDLCPDEPGTKADHGCPRTLQEGKTTFEIPTIYFDLDKNSIRKDAISDLNRVLNWLLDHPEYMLQMDVYSNEGTEAYNIAISDRRAKAIVQYLTGKGVQPSRLSYTAKSLRNISASDSNAPQFAKLRLVKNRGESGN